MEDTPKLTRPFVNRIVGHGEEDPEDLLANPYNWRIHPRDQQLALTGAIDEIGFTRSVTVNVRSGEEWPVGDRNVRTVVDGHLRVILALRSGVNALPVEYVDLNPDEEYLSLMTLDPIATFAVGERRMLQDLYMKIKSDEERIQDMLQRILAEQRAFTDVSALDEIVDGEDGQAYKSKGEQEFENPYMGFTVPMTIAQRNEAFRILNLAKEIKGLKTSTDALLTIFAEWEASHADD